MRFPFESYCIRTQGGTIRVRATKDKFISHLNHFLMLQRTVGGLVSGLEVQDMLDINWSAYVLRHKDGSINVEATVERFEDDLNSWMDEQKRSAEKYKKALLSQFKRPGQKIPAPLLAAFAAASMGLDATTENQHTFLAAIDELVQQGVFQRGRGKAGGISLTSAPATDSEPSIYEKAMEEEEDEEQETPEIPEKRKINKK